MKFNKKISLYLYCTVEYTIIISLYNPNYKYQTFFQYDRNYVNISLSDPEIDYEHDRLSLQKKKSFNKN